MPSKRKEMSHRLTLREKHHRLKKAKERAERARKKEREMARSNRTKRDPGIPNLYPFKKQMLEAILGDGQRIPTKEELDIRTRQQAAAYVSAQQVQQDLVSLPVEASHAQTNLYNASRDATNMSEKSIRRGAFKQELQQVIEQADVIMEVIDARDPKGTRCPEIENICAEKRKPFVLVMNKVDLVPQQVARAWLTYFKNHAVPCIAFKSSTHDHKGHEVNLSKFVDGETGSKHAEDRLSRALHDPRAIIGASELKHLLHKIDARKAAASTPETKDAAMRTKIVAAVVGIPNVGKSSIINSLSSRNAVGVAPIPGYTKKISEIHIDLRLRILDSPGVVLNEGGNVILREEKLVDPIGECTRMLSMMKDYAAVFRAFNVFDDVLKRAESSAAVADCLRRADELLSQPVSEEIAFGDNQGLSARECLLAELTRELLVCVARKKGKLLPGGIPDLDWAARNCIRDWNRGRVPFYKAPPTQEELAKEETLRSERQAGIQRMNELGMGEGNRILTELAPELDIDALFALSTGLVGDTEEDLGNYAILR